MIKGDFEAFDLEIADFLHFWRIICLNYIKIK